jgi:hypothetical protein
VFGLAGVVAGSLTNSLATTMFAAVKAQAGVATYMGRLLPSSQLTGLTLVDLNPPGNLAGGVATGTAMAGSSAAVDNLSTHLAACVTLYTNLKGKSYRGRVFLPGLTEADSDAAGLIITASNGFAVGFVNGVKTAIAASNPLVMAVVSPELIARPNAKGQTLPPKSASTNPVTTVVARNTSWSTQRARQRRK